MTNQEDSPLKKYIIFYLDIGIRSFVAFIIIGIGCFIIFVGFLKMKPIWVLPITFLFSIILSPLLSKIRIADKLFKKYDEFLVRVFNLT